jgi:hypothetical protein
MPPTALSLALLAVAAASPAGPAPLPTLAKEPSIDGVLADLSPAQAFRLPPAAKGSSANLTIKGTFRHDTLYLGVTVNDDRVGSLDRLDLMLYFPDSGITSRGLVYRFGPDGASAPLAEHGPPSWAQALVRSATKRGPRGFTLEVALPARALPRFQASKPLLLTVCAEYSDVDQDRPPAEPSLISSCESQDMPGGPIRLPDELRKNLRLEPTRDVEGIEAREHGWIGFSRLHFPTWAEGDASLSPQALAELVAGEEAIDPLSVALPLPRQLTLPDNRPIFMVLTGTDPYGKSSCADGAELRLALYLVEGRAASRVLEWPAATCKLGRAMRFELSADGGLTIGYTNGSTARFTWTGDHFERSELG